MKFVPGPIFANVLLADEINRTPPKTQAALLEAMQEHQVTSGGTRYNLPEPFFVLATQNPIEMEGTYPLPEAQLDRFMFNVMLDYLSEDDEVTVVTQTTSRKPDPISPIFTGDDIRGFHEVVRKVRWQKKWFGMRFKLLPQLDLAKTIRQVSWMSALAGELDCARPRT